MAIGWVGMLSMVPWGDVIKAAPEVAATARKLWDAVGKKDPQRDAIKGADGALHTSTSMLARLEDAETRLAALHVQMLTASEVISSLAQQNAKLVEQAEVLRKRMLIQGIVTGALSLIAIALAAACWLSRSAA